MKAIILLVFIWLGVVITSFGQNNAKFHHVIDQQLIDDSGFILIREIDKKRRTMLIHKAKGFEKRKFKAIISLESRRPVLDIWEVDTLGEELTNWWQRNFSKLRNIQFDPTRDEFGNKIGEQSDTINAGTLYEGATFYLDEQRKTLGNSTKVLKVPFTAWTWAIATTPLRYRFKADSSESTLSSTLSVSLSFGKTWGKTTFTSRLARNRSFILAPFVGIGSADLKKSTVKEPRNWEKQKIGDRTNLAFSYGGSLTMAINNLGIVVSLGWDKAVGSYSSRWSYNKKPWIGLGINTGLGIFR